MNIWFIFYYYWDFRFELLKAFSVLISLWNCWVNFCIVIQYVSIVSSHLGAQNMDHNFSPSQHIAHCTHVTQCQIVDWGNKARFSKPHYKDFITEHILSVPCSGPIIIPNLFQLTLQSISNYVRESSYALIKPEYGSQFLECWKPFRQFLHKNPFLLSHILQGFLINYLNSIR